MSNNIIKKIISFWQKPKIVIISSRENQEIIRKFISRVLGSSLVKEIFIRDSAQNLDFYLSPKEHLILNFDFDKEKMGDIKGKTKASIFTFGFQEGADFRATDVKLNGGTNFKINYKGNSVPVWLEKPANDEEIYSALSAVVVGVIFNQNLVKISQALGLTSAGK